MLSLFDAVSCGEYVENCFPGRGLVGGNPHGESQRAQPPAFDYIVTDFVYIIPILARSVPGNFHGLPCYQGQKCGVWGVSRHNFYLYVY